MTTWRGSTGNKPVQEIQKATAVKAESALAVSGQCVFNGIWVKTDGTNDVTFSLYDNVAASGTEILPGPIVVQAEKKGMFISLGKPIEIHNGIYVSISGGTFKYQVFYDD